MSRAAKDFRRLLSIISSFYQYVCTCPTISDRLLIPFLSYLYPSEVIEVSVELDFDGLTVTYPEYDGGWSVTAYPDGTLIDESGAEYGS